LLAHGLKRVVEAALFAHRGDSFLAESLAAERTGTVGWIDEAGVGKREQFVLEGIEEETAEVGGGPAQRRAKIGAADVADEQGVAGENGVRLGTTAMEIEDEKRNGFGSMAGSFEGLDTHASELDRGTVGERGETILGLSLRTEVNRSAKAIAKFEMAGDKIGVKVGEENVLDLEVVFAGEGKVTVDVALGIDDGGDAGGFVGDEVGGVGETVEIELLEEHGEESTGRQRRVASRRGQTWRDSSLRRLRSE